MMAVFRKIIVAFIVLSMLSSLAGCELSDEWVYPEAWKFLNSSQLQWASDLTATECYGSGGEFYCNSKIDFEYKNGSYKIVKVTDLA